MNAAIRSAVRTALSRGHRVYGSLEGYKGIIEGNFVELKLRSVANIIHRGGTILKTSRCPEFFEEEKRKEAYKNLKDKNIDLLLALGGDGTLKGLEGFHKEYSDIAAVAVPCTIDNDFPSTDLCIGYQTAVQTAVEAIDRIRDTASSHQRTFIIEVMGHKSPDLAYAVALAAGAESVVDLSEEETLNHCIRQVKESINKGKMSSLIVVLEQKGESESAAMIVKKRIAQNLKIDCRAAVLGHIQRGGSPLANDRILASELSYKAILQLEDKKSGLVGFQDGAVNFIPMGAFKEQRKDYDQSKKILETLAN